MQKSATTTIAKKLKPLVDFDELGRPRFDPKTYVIISIIGVTALAIQFHKNPVPLKVTQTIEADIDTFIPDGMSLVPIKISNYESLDQIIGKYGVVDLYTTPISHLHKAKKVAYRVKLLRAPNDPSNFSALVPANEAYRLASFQGEFTVSIRNKKIIGTKFVKQKRVSKAGRVSFEEGE